MSDLIRREDAIEAMKQRYDDILRTFKRKVKVGEKAIVMDMIGCVKALPSADRPSEVIYGNEHNCIMTIFGECSYAETGCGDCAVVEKVRKALSADRPNAVDLSSVYSTAYRSGYEKGKADRPSGEWIYIDEPMIGNPYGRYKCSECNLEEPFTSDFCPNCGCQMKGADDE